MRKFFMKNIFLILTASLLFLSACDMRLREPETYAGNAKRTETNCLNQCDSCTTDDKLELHLDTSNERHIKGSATGSCIAYGEKCIFRDSCTWLFEGTYDADSGSLEFTSCNGESVKAEGSGKFRDGKSSGTVKCIVSDHGDSAVMTWSDVAISKGR